MSIARLRALMPVVLDRRAAAGASLLFLANFALAKGAVYLLPLAVAAVATPTLYGATELAQSIGLLATSLLLAAPLNGVTFVYLMRGERRIADQFALTALVSAGISLAAFAIGLVAGLQPVPLLVLASIGIAVLHNVFSTIARTLGRRNATAWGDGTAALVTGGVVLVLVVNGRGTLPAATTAFAIVTAALVVASAWLLFRLRQPGLTARFVRSCRIGLPMTISGIFAIWIGVGGRITVGLVNGSDVAAFGVAFRIAGLALGVHQLVITALFAWLYRGRTRTADPLLAVFLALAAVVSAALTLAGPFIAAQVGFAALAGSGLALFDRLLPIVGVQVFFWIAFAMLQIRVNRAGLAARSIGVLAAVFGAGAAAIFLVVALAGPVSTVTLCWLIAAHNAAYACALWWLLARRRLPHRRIGIVMLCGGTALVLLALIRS